MKNLDRFRMLEGERPTAPAEPTAHHVSERFVAVGAAAPAEPPPAPPPVDPFAPPPPPAYDLDPEDVRGDRRSVRCAACAHENGPYAELCATCGESLKSGTVRRLNLRVAQDEAAAAFEAKRAAARAEVPPEVAPEAPRPLLDRVADQVASGPTGTWSMPVRRAVVVGGVACLLGMFWLTTGSPVFGFLIGLVVTLGLFLLPT